MREHRLEVADVFRTYEKKNSSHNGAVCSERISEKPSQRSATAARRRWAAMWNM